MLSDEDLWGCTLEELHLEYAGAEDAGGGDFTEELRDRVMDLLISGRPEKEDAHANH